MHTNEMKWMKEAKESSGSFENDDFKVYFFSDKAFDSKDI